MDAGSGRVPVRAAPGCGDRTVLAMTPSEVRPSAWALEEVRRLAGRTAAIRNVARLYGGQHAGTWRVDTEGPATSVVVRQFPTADPAASRERDVLRTLDGLDGLAPVVLGGDVDGRRSGHPTTLISWLDGESDITPSDPQPWAAELGRALAVVQAVSNDRLGALPSVFDGRGAASGLHGPLAPRVRSRWSQIVNQPAVLVHSDYWSGNVVWRDGRLTGVVDWSSAGRGPRGYDLGWCRLDLVLLFDERIADAFLGAYEAAIGRPVHDVALWDAWAAARSHHTVQTWAPNYAPLGRADLDECELRRRHARWTTRLTARG